MTSPTATAEIERLVEQLSERLKCFYPDADLELGFLASDIHALLAALRAAEAERDEANLIIMMTAKFVEMKLQMIVDQSKRKLLIETASFLRGEFPDYARAALQSTSAKEGE